MSLNRKILLVISLIIGLLLISFVIWLNTPSKIGTPLINTEILEFENGAKIYLRVKVWGLAGNHEEAVVSETPINITDKETQYVFYTSEIFYKKDNNTLTIYGTNFSDSIPKTPFKDIQIVVKELKTSNEIFDYRANYEKYGLERLSVYDSLPTSINELPEP